MKKHIVCLGDSNTHGYCADPADCADHGDPSIPQVLRFNEDERWTCLLQKALGDDYLVIEEGLNGRTTCFADPVNEGMSALDYIYPCLKSHEPVSLLIIMLGTNDTKERFSAGVGAIGKGLERLVKKAMTTEAWGTAGKPNILVIAPLPIGAGMESSALYGTMGKGCLEKSEGVPAEFRAVSARLGVHFLDAAELGCTFNEIDYLHLTRASHAKLAEELAKKIPALV